MGSMAGWFQSLATLGKKRFGDMVFWGKRVLGTICIGGRFECVTLDIVIEE